MESTTFRRFRDFGFCILVLLLPLGTVAASADMPGLRADLDAALVAEKQTFFDMLANKTPETVAAYERASAAVDRQMKVLHVAESKPGQTADTVADVAVSEDIEALTQRAATATNAAEREQIIGELVRTEHRRPTRAEPADSEFFLTAFFKAIFRPLLAVPQAIASIFNRPSGPEARALAILKSRRAESERRLKLATKGLKKARRHAEELAETLADAGHELKTAESRLALARAELNAGVSAVADVASADERQRVAGMLRARERRMRKAEAIVRAARSGYVQVAERHQAAIKYAEMVQLKVDRTRRELELTKAAYRHARDDRG